MNTLQNFFKLGFSVNQLDSTFRICHSVVIQKFLSQSLVCSINVFSVYSSGTFKNKQ